MEMTEEIKKAFLNLCEKASTSDSKNLANLFYRSEDMDEFEIPSFQNFLRNNEVLCERVVSVNNASGEKEETGPVVRVFYSYKSAKSEKPVSTEYTWFAFRKSDTGDWKVTGKGVYLKHLSQIRQWRRLEGDRITHYFDYSIKKSMDSIHAGCAHDEYKKLEEYMEEEGLESPLDYFVFDDEKSLSELGFEASTAGFDWIFSNQPCDLFQMCSQRLRRLNGRIPRFFLFGFSAYYAQFAAEGRYPVFNISKESFSGKVAEIMEGLPMDKATKLCSNVEFDQWAQYVALFTVMSRANVHPHTTMLLILSSFIKFLMESPDIGSSPSIRKEQLLKTFKNGTTENFENVFKEVTGMKLRKADKLWRKFLKKAK